MKIIIVGGGIGGPALALALRRIGHEVDIYEAYCEPSDDIGYFLNLASNGIHVLRELDAWFPEQLDLHPMPSMVFHSGRGKVLGEVNNGVRLADGTVSSTVKRSRLHLVLTEAARQAGACIHYGRRVQEIDDVGCEIGVRFEDGTTDQADLLVGADGIHSTVRDHVHPAAPAPDYTGLISVAGYSRGTTLAPTPDKMHMQFGKRAFFGHLVRPSGEVYWFANVACEVPSVDDLDEADWKARLSELFADDGPLPTEVIEHTYSSIGAFPVYDLGALEQWHRGRAVLVGDAAHATSPSAGQGASLALEDALILASCLREVSNIEDTLAQYQQLRHRRAEKIVAYSRKLGQQKAVGPVGAWFRDLLMPLMLRLFANQDSHAWIYNYSPSLFETGEPSHSEAS